MKQTTKKILLVVIIVFLSMLVFTISFCRFGYTACMAEKGNYTYSNVLHNAYLNNSNFGTTSITQIAMLGSHDSFSENIDADSIYNTNEDFEIRNKVLQYLTKGVVSRYAKAQNHSALVQAQAGVRYFDLRITYIDNEFYTSHTLVSSKLQDSLLGILQFLDQNEGEFILLDFTHFYRGSSSWNDLANYISTTKYNNKNLYDYINYDISKQVQDITYNDMTNNGTKSGVMLIANAGNVDNTYSKYFLKKSIYSPWIEKSTVNQTVEHLEREVDFLKNLEFTQLRVAQTQSSFCVDNALYCLSKWSLLCMAREDNAKLLSKINVSNLLKTMPIYLTDYSTSCHKNFNDEINSIIYNHNLSL